MRAPWLCLVALAFAGAHEHFEVEIKGDSCAVISLTHEKKAAPDCVLEIEISNEIILISPCSTPARFCPTSIKGKCVIFKGKAVIGSEVIASVTKLSTCEQGESSMWSYFVFYPLADVVGGFSLCFAIIGVFDYFFVANKPGRWFALHAFANLIITIASLPAVICWIIDPLSSMSALKYPVGQIFDSVLYPNNQISALMVPSIHLYHVIVFYKELTRSDIFHHAIFVPPICIVGLLLRWGVARNVLAFFICGLPGGMDYFFLFLVKNGKLDRLEEKRRMSILNNWIRSPFLVLHAATMYLTWLYESADGTSSFFAFLVACLVLFNAQYYSEMAIGNYHMHVALQRGTSGSEKKKHSE